MFDLNQEEKKGPYPTLKGHVPIKSEKIMSYEYPSPLKLHLSFVNTNCKSPNLTSPRKEVDAALFQSSFKLSEVAEINIFKYINTGPRINKYF